MPANVMLMNALEDWVQPFISSWIRISQLFPQGVGEGKAHSVQQGILPKMAIGDVQYEDLKCSFVGKAGLDMSLYIDGLICNEMLGKCKTVLDFARDRLMFIPRL